MYWGYHLLLDCSGCKNIDSRDMIYRFVKDLVARIDMTAHGEPIIEYLLPGDPKQGYSLMQLITTSNISGHLWNWTAQPILTFSVAKNLTLKQPNKWYVIILLQNAYV